MDIKTIYKKIGFPRLIITAFLIILLGISTYVGISQREIWGGILTRFGMNAILVLAMVPSIQSGIGINFNLALGVIFGLIGALVSIELGLTGWASFALALAIAIPLAAGAGYLYGLMLNRIKGQEMTVGTYVGFSIISFMCIFWLVAPFTSPELIWAMGGSGLRVTLSMESSMGGLLDNFLNPSWLPSWMQVIPIGLILFFALIAFIVCTRSADRRINYSGYQALLLYFMQDAQYFSDYYVYLKKLDKQVLDEIRFRQQYYYGLQNKVMEHAHEKIYDAYLKTNQVTSGIKNYNQVVELAVSWLVRESKLSE